jgi:hypothetical protein
MSLSSQGHELADQPASALVRGNSAPLSLSRLIKSIQRGHVARRLGVHDRHRVTGLSNMIPHDSDARTRRVCRMLLLLSLISLDACRATAQEQQPDRSETAGRISLERPFVPAIEPCAVLSSSSTSNSPPSACSDACRRSPLVVNEPEDEPPGFGPGVGPGGQGPISYKTSWFPGVPVRGQAGDWGLLEEDLSLALPLWADSRQTVMVTAAVRNRRIDTDATLPDSHEAYPSELWNIQAGAMYRAQLDGDRMIGGGVSLGSASDDPFTSLQDSYVNLNAMYRTPSGEHNAWMFMLMYSPLSEIPYPLPLVSYSYNPSDQLHANIGLPFMLSYKPTDRWRFDASYMLINAIHAKATYRITNRASLFSAFDSLNEAYRLRDRISNDDMFFLCSQRARIGLSLPLTKLLTAEIAGGYAFKRYSFTGQQWDSTGTDRVDLEPGPFVSLSMSLRR